MSTEKYPFLKSIYRTHTCGELRKAQVNSTVTLSGWIMRMRDHGGVVFIDLRDNYGVTQVVASGALGQQLQSEKVETVITVVGKVLPRDEKMVNPKIPTGEVEVHADKVTVQSRADVLPFQIAEDDNAPEPARLKHRFLELRREKLHQNVLLRSKVIRGIRDIMDTLGFTEFQTPILTSSSPEGARDFIVPSRLHPGKFYALPQAPQQFKQLLMVAGFDRYFQIAPCFRDEDARADRSPGEFYQLDIECSFVEQEDIFKIGEEIFTSLFTKFAGWNKERPYSVSSAPFRRIPFDQALRVYGSDKPDLRNPLVIDEVSEVFAKTEFRVFRQVLDSGGVVRTIKLSLDATPPRKYFDDTIEYFKKLTGGQGLAYLIFERGEVKGSIAKFISKEEIAALTQLLKIDAQGIAVTFFAAGKEREVAIPLGRLRTKLGEDFKKIDRERFEFCWVTDFPFFERDEESGGIQFTHNPFTMPYGGLEALTSQDPLTIKAMQYDIVCNGYELSSGGVRNHLPEIMYKAFELVGHPRSTVDEKFGGMIRAFKFGAPPHAGFAPGIDRMVMLLAGEEALREIIAFPMAQNGEDLLMSAPCTVTEKQLKEAHIRVELPPKKGE